MPEARSALSPAELIRYGRHILIDEFGVAGQERLAGARVLVVGAGGLGSPAALYLAAAGVGAIGIADFDQVEEHNLQRQLLHETATVGQSKVASAARRLRATNPFIQVREHAAGVTEANAADLFREYDVIIDGTDRFSSRYLINDAAVRVRRPLVHGSVFRFEGQVTVFDPARGGPCYRCLFPHPPAPGSVPGCGEAGVLGPVCGVIGSLQAVEAIKLITGIGEPLCGRLLTYDGRLAHVEVLTLRRDPACPLCGDSPVDSLEEADDVCAPLRGPAARDGVPIEISPAEAQTLRQTRPEAVLVIDVREPFELEICRLDGATHVPMRCIPQELQHLPRDKHLLILCHTGVRSRHVTEFLRAQGMSDVSNISGGIDAWAEALDSGLPRY